MEIMAQILVFCIRERRKTRIMYGTNLSHTQLKAFLKFLMSRGLLAHSSDRYVTTEKGQHFLKAFARLNNMLEDPARRGFHEAPREGLGGESVNRPHGANSQVGKRARAKPRSREPR